MSNKGRGKPVDEFTPEEIARMDAILKEVEERPRTVPCDDCGRETKWGIYNDTQEYHAYSYSKAQCTRCFMGPMGWEEPCPMGEPVGIMILDPEDMAFRDATEEERDELSAAIWEQTEEDNANAILAT